MSFPEKNVSTGSYTPVVRLAHSILRNPTCYSMLQISVGAEGFRNRFLNQEMRRFTEGAEVVDLGCGPGANRKVLGENFEYVGIDLSSEYVSKAEKRFVNETGTKFVQADLVNDSSWTTYIRPNSPTVGLAFALWHHLSDDQIASILSRLYLSTNEDLHLISVDPIITENSSKLAVWLAKNDRGPFLRNQNEFEKLYSSNGFSVETHIYSGEMRIPGSVISIRARKK